MAHETLTTPVAEEWRPVKWYEGLYEVSNLGVVRSIDRTEEVLYKGKPYSARGYGGLYLQGQ